MSISKNNKICKLNILTVFAFLCLAVIFNATDYFVKNANAQVQFTEDTIVSLTGITDGNLKIASSSECVSFTIENSVLTIAGIPIANDFILKTAINGSTPVHSNGLKLTPTGGILDLALNSNNISLGNITQWTLNASPGTTVNHIIGVSQASAYYNIKVDGILLDSYQSSLSKEVDFTYNNETLPEKVFTIESSDDATAPTRMKGSPNSSLSANTAQTILSLTTNETATCKYSTTAGTDYGSMTSFTDTNNITHSSTITGLTNGSSYNYYVKCEDEVGNINSSDYLISFSVNSAGGGIPIWMLNQQIPVQPYDSEEDGEQNIDVLENIDNKDEQQPTIIRDKAKQTAKTIVNITNEAIDIFQVKINIILSKLGIKRNLEKEKNTVSKYAGKIIDKNINPKTNYSIINFITYGTPTTETLGQGERAGVINSYKTTFSKLPNNEIEWSDVIKIANGRWTSKTNKQAESRAVLNFKIVYQREPNRDNPNDDAAITIMAYGLRPNQRNINSEQQAIKYFQDIYGYAPKTARAWDVVRAIAYSGAIR